MSRIITIATFAAVKLGDTKAGDQVLLVKKRGLEELIHPGGKLEEGEAPDVAVRREVWEELNCGISGMHFAGFFVDDAAFSRHEAGTQVIEGAVLEHLVRDVDQGIHLGHS